MKNGIPLAVIREVSFKRCAQFVIMQTVFTLITAIILSGKLIPPHSFLYLTLDIVNVLFNLYICLGYVKYAHVVNEDKLSLILGIVIILHILQFVANILGEGHYLEIKGYQYFWYVKSLLMFLGLRLVKSSEHDFLSKISRLYFSLFIVAMLLAIGNTSFPSYVTIPLILSAIYFIPALMYWEFKLFNHLQYLYGINSSPRENLTLSHDSKNA
jgi:hypothetical protein